MGHSVWPDVLYEQSKDRGAPRVDPALEKLGLETSH